MYCRFCGKQIPDNAKFCPECGADLAPAPSAAPAGRHSVLPRCVGSSGRTGHAARRVRPIPPPRPVLSKRPSAA